MTEMTCREFDEIVHAFVRMDLLDVNVREAALEHAAHCELCSERLADAAALAEASDALGKSRRNEETPAHVEAGLLTSFRHYHRRASWRRTLEWASVGAAAAVLLIFLWTMNGRSRLQSPQAPRKDVSSQSDIPLDAKATEAPKEDAAELVADATVPDAAVNESYVASDFVPVPYTGAISTDDPGMIVRVQLTRSSLAQLGYPVAETPDEDLILADVLVGEDGWPRGVKLIQ
jgi:hypothetical protein